MAGLRRSRGLVTIGVTAVLVCAGVAAAVSASAAGCRVAYSVGSQWAGGFTANVAVTNLGDPVNGWSLAWTFPSGQQATQAWNATITTSGSQVAATNVSYNGTVATNGTVSFGFNGSWSGSNTAPSSFAFNGVACTGSVGGPSASPSPSRSPSASPSTSPPPAGDPMAAVAAMQPGWNLGNTFDSTGSDETSWGNPRVTQALLDNVRAEGFKSIRIPVTWGQHQGAAPSYTVDSAYLNRVKEVVDWALADGFYVMINVHHDSWQWIANMPGDHDSIVRVTSTGICGSDLHLYEVLGPFLAEGDILGHEPMGIVEEVGPRVTAVAPGDRVVVPFNVSCGTCFMCQQGLHSQCETTQVRKEHSGAALFGYTRLYGQVPGGQAQYLRVPFGNTLPIKVPEGPPDDRFVYLSDVLPTAWQAVEYAAIPPGGSVAVLGLGPIGQMSARVALHRGAGQVIGVDRVPERLAQAGGRGVEVLDLREHDDIAEKIRELTGGRGPDAVIDAVGMEAHGAPVAKLAQQSVSLLPDRVAAALMRRAGVDRLHALYLAIDIVRRGGTISLSGVYGGMTDPIPMLTLFDKQIQLRMGQANVHRWVPQILPLLTDADPLGVDGFASHHLPLRQAPRAYQMFQRKQDGAVKVLLQP